MPLQTGVVQFKLPY